MGRYYGATFKGARGMTQEDPLSPNIFNVMLDVMLDVVLQEWVSVMVESKGEQGGIRQEGRHQNALFYADDGTVAWSDPRLL